MLIPVLFLLIALSLFVPALQMRMRRRMRSDPAAVFLVPAVLSIALSPSAWRLHVLSPVLGALFFAYAFAPTIVAFVAQRFVKTPSWLDVAVVLMLWLPLEFGAGSRWIPVSAQGALHTTAYGAAITLALALLLLYRDLKGMKYNWPAKFRDWIYPLAGFALAAPVLILLGYLLAFVKPFHMPGHLTATMLGRQFLIILAATALPEEILFRSLIQNLIMQKFGSSNATLLLSAAIFGSAHLNNAPGPLPNWRYAVIATVAGFAFGKVFQKASSVWSSAMLHAMVNTTKHVFF